MAEMEATIQSVEGQGDLPGEIIETMTTACEIFAEALDQCDMPDYGKVVLGFDQANHDIVLQYRKNVEGDGYDAKAEIVRKGEDKDARVNTDPF